MRGCVGKRGRGRPRKYAVSNNTSSDPLRLEATLSPRSNPDLRACTHASPVFSSCLGVVGTSFRFCYCGRYVRMHSRVIFCKCGHRIQDNEIPKIEELWLEEYQEDGYLVGVPDPFY